MYAVDAATGKLLWRSSVDKHPSARITGAPALYRGRLYVPVASLEELTGSLPDYECCSFRGSVVALETTTGKQIWKTFTITEEPLPRGPNKKGVQRVGPSGGGIWSTPTLDVNRNTLYVTTGDNYSQPATTTSDAIMAVSMDSGKVLWSRQMTANDAWNVACFGGDATNCPEGAGPDHDFASPAILVDLPGGRRALVAGQKSGVVHAVDPDRQGEILWQVRLSEGGIFGGVEWGPAADGANVYVALSDLKSNLAVVDNKVGGGVHALQLADGKHVWTADSVPCPSDRKGCSPGHSAAVTVIPGVVFSGSLDGHLRAYSTTDGRVLWDYDTAREFETANGVPGRGGAINGPGPTIVGGMLFVNSGYGFVGQMPGNVLLAFSTEP
ncbi:MAG: hypothetical protein C5B57_11280 [Blastocatellia bacterium]|nr:MAG: hypothetical protein C5B57_11280 [Blastocatellia bacterium]